MASSLEKRREELTRRPLYLYDLPEDILATLQLRDETEAEKEESLTTTDNPNYTGDRDLTVGAKACSLCNVTFGSLEDQRSHVRSDFHGYNLKRKVRGLGAVSELEFEKLIGDLDESLSGSDSSDSDSDESSRKDSVLSALLKKQAKISETAEIDDTPRRQRGSGKPPLIWFSSSVFPNNTYLGIYRAIFSQQEQASEKFAEAIKNGQLTPKPAPKNADNGTTPKPEDYAGPHVFLCMIGGGHFAAMVVSLAPRQVKSHTGPLSREATVLAHKTFHRYTTRRKQGGSQSANDAAKGAAHSAGSSLRRYNEQALTEEVRALLSEWKGMIDTSSLLFIRATGSTSRRTLFGPYDGQVLKSNDPRVRGFPFTTRRATQAELMRSFVELTRVKIREVDLEAIAAANAAAEAAQKEATAAHAQKKSAPAAPKRSEEEETALLHTSQIQAMIKRSRVPPLLSYLKANELSPDFHFYPKDSSANYHTPTPLHLAASQNSPPLVTALIVKAGASPLLLNGEGKTPFDIAGDRPTRDAFRVARASLGESKWDWDAARIPSALTMEEVNERDRQEKTEAARAEDARRKAAEERLKTEGPKVRENAALGKAAGRGRALALGNVQRTAEEARQVETRGLTPEAKARLEREKRARAAEERFKRLQGGT